MSLLSIYSGSACAWIISEINRDTMGELQVVIPKAASTLLYPMVRPLTVRLGSLLLRIYSAFSSVLFSALYFLKTANIQELNVLLFAEYLLLCGIAELSLWGVRGVREKRIWRVWIVTILASVIALGMFLVLEMSRNVQSGNTQNLKSMVIQRIFPKWSVAERRKTAAASDQAAVCACAHSRYFAGGSPSGLRV